MRGIASRTGKSSLTRIVQSPGGARALAAKISNGRTAELSVKRCVACDRSTTVCGVLPMPCSSLNCATRSVYEVQMKLNARTRRCCRRACRGVNSRKRIRHLTPTDTLQRAARRSHSETVLKMLSCPLLPKLSLTHLSDSDPLQTCAVP